MNLWVSTQKLGVRRKQDIISKHIMIQFLNSIMLNYRIGIYSSRVFSSFHIKKNQTD